MMNQQRRHVKSLLTFLILLASNSLCQDIEIKFRKSIFDDGYVAIVKNISRNRFAGEFHHRQTKTPFALLPGVAAEFGWVQGYRIYGNNIVEIVSKESDTIRVSSPSDSYLNGYTIEIHGDGIYLSISPAFLQRQLDKISPPKYEASGLIVKLRNLPIISLDEVRQRIQLKIDVSAGIMVKSRFVDLIPAAFSVSGYPYIDKATNRIAFKSGSLDSVLIFNEKNEYTELVKNCINTFILPQILQQQSLSIPDDLQKHIKFISNDCVSKYHISNNRLSVPVNMSGCIQALMQ